MALSRMKRDPTIVPGEEALLGGEDTLGGAKSN
jgi:hypothetical protein